MNRTDTLVSRGLRWVLLAGFSWKIFKAFSFGWGLSAAVVLLATGSVGKRSPLVPIPGVVRIVLEVAIMFFGLAATHKTRGTLWLVLAIVVTITSLLLSGRRMSALLRQRSA